jgi:hypothetical protein
MINFHNKILKIMLQLEKPLLNYVKMMKAHYLN